MKILQFELKTTQTKLSTVSQVLIKKINGRSMNDEVLLRYAVDRSSSNRSSPLLLMVVNFQYFAFRLLFQSGLSSKLKTYNRFIR